MDKKTDRGRSRGRDLANNPLQRGSSKVLYSGSEDEGGTPKLTGDRKREREGGGGSRSSGSSSTKPTKPTTTTKPAEPPTANPGSSGYASSFSKKAERSRSRGPRDKPKLTTAMDDLKITSPQFIGKPAPTDVSTTQDASSTNSRAVSAPKPRTDSESSTSTRHSVFSTADSGNKTGVTTPSGSRPSSRMDVNGLKVPPQFGDDSGQQSAATTPRATTPTGKSTKRKSKDDLKKAQPDQYFSQSTSQ